MHAIPPFSPFPLPVAVAGGYVGFAIPGEREMASLRDHRPKELPMLRPPCSRASTAALLCLLSLCSQAGRLHAQSPRLDSLIAGNVHTFTLVDGHLAGRGAQLLEDAARGAHFVVLGESHNTRAIPEFTVGLFRLLHDSHGFQHLALEEGPELGRLVSERIRGGAADAAFRLALEYPNAFHFYNEQYVRMFDRIGAISRAAEPIWGINQEFATAHVFARLVSIAPDDDARQVAAGLLQRSREYEGERFARNVSFISHRLTPGDLEALRSAFRPMPGSPADVLISQTELSHRIFAPYATTPRPHFTRFFASNVERERNMKVLFSDHLRAATSAAGATSRVLVKSGFEHTLRGRGRSPSYTLGNFLMELAIFFGGHDLNIVVLPNWEQPAEPFQPLFAPFRDHLKPGANTIFDLRPLRPWAEWNALGDLHPELHRLLVGADMFIVLADAEWGSLEALRTPNFRWYPGSSR